MVSTLVCEVLLFRESALSAAGRLGLGSTNGKTLALAIGVCLLILATIPIFAWITHASVRLLPGGLSLLPGLFAQGGIAEEVLFRGYLFGHLRRGRTFWRAAWLSMVPFVAAHTFLFFTMPWPIASAALLSSAALSFPLAHLFELGKNSIWAPAIVHFVIQGTVKIVIVSGEAAPSFPLVWMAAGLVIVNLVLFFPRDKAV